MQKHTLGKGQCSPWENSHPPPVREIKNHHKQRTHLCMHSPSSLPRKIREPFTFLIPGFHGHAKVPGLNFTLVHRDT